MENPADRIYILFQLGLGPEGRVKAFNRIWIIYSSRVLFFISRILSCDPSSAEDCFQEVMLKVFDGLDFFRPNYPLKPWIYAIARNHAVDFLRRKRDDDDINESHPSDPSVDPACRIMDAELSKAIDAALGCLNDEDSQIAYLRFYEEMKIKDIASVLGMNINTVKTKITSIKRILQDDLRGWL